jgi:hypothetical protein
MLGVITGFKGVAAIEIVWRNPNAVRRLRRRHSFERAGERVRYILQEFVEDGPTSYWTTLAGLEVVLGGRIA